LFGAEDRFASTAGSQAYLRALNGLTVDNIGESIVAKLGGAASC
jgi:hypothetical protein